MVDHPNEALPQCVGSGGEVRHFLGAFRRVRGNPVPSSALMEPMTRRFVGALERYAAHAGVDLIRFDRGERKDDRTKQYLRGSTGAEGVLYIGKAQEKARVVRTERREDPVRGPDPWLVSSTAMVNHYYVYAVDDDFGPFFLKFCSYSPYNAKLCVNVHKYLKRQLAKRGVAFEALDNGVLRCADPALMRRLAAGLTAGRNDAPRGKWLRACRTRSAAPTAGPASATTSRSCKPSSPSPRCSTGPSRGGCSSRRSCARTSTWAVPTMCS